MEETGFAPERHAAYATIARAIAFIRSNAGRQPSLAEVARHVGLSDYHFQRLFSEWAGISPKRFLQYLTKEHARRLLAESRDVLDAALESGLSGAGRLHDLMVACEAMTPGEMRAQGAGLTIRHGFAETPLGTLLAGETGRGICHLHFVEAAERQAAVQRLRADWPRAAFHRDDGAAGRLARRMFAGDAPGKPLRLLLRGTNFQIKVWEALLRIPAGRVLSYGSLAQLAGVPRAPRVVGSALARNGIAVLIPCHRVIRESGESGEYRWGAPRKAALLAWEQGRTESAAN